MPNNYDASVARRSKKPIYIITIEGIGDENGIWKFCSRVPSYGTTTTYKPALLTIPKTSTAEVDPIGGGVAKAGAISFSLLDYPEYAGDAGLFTRTFQPERQSATNIPAGTWGASDTTITTSSTQNLTSGKMVWVASEAMLIASM